MCHVLNPPATCFTYFLPHPPHPEQVLPGRQDAAGVDGQLDPRQHRRHGHQVRGRGQRLRDGLGAGAQAPHCLSKTRKFGRGHLPMKGRPLSSLKLWGTIIAMKTVNNCNFRHMKSGCVARTCAILPPYYFIEEFIKAPECGHGACHLARRLPEEKICGYNVKD